jgi:PAS domain S-box-containing protein
MAMDLELERFCVAIVRDGPDAVVHADREGIIRFWNGGAERIFGFGEVEALGRSLDLIVPETLRPRHWAAFHETMRTGRTRYGESDVLAVPALRKDGTRISVEFTVVPFHAEGGRLSGIVAVVRDVTKRFEETTALRKELARLRAAGPG